MIVVNQYRWTMFFFYIIGRWQWLVLSHKRHSYFEKVLCWNIISLDLRYKIYGHSTYTQNCYKNNLFLPNIRISGKNVSFEDKKNLKSDFYKNKKVTNIDDIDVNKILVSKEKPYGTKNSFKYFIGYNDNDIIRPLCITIRYAYP